MPENKKFWKFCNQAGNKVELLLYGDISQTSWWGDEVTPKQFAEELAGLGALDEITVRINSGGGDVFAAGVCGGRSPVHPKRAGRLPEEHQRHHLYRAGQQGDRRKRQHLHGASGAHGRLWLLQRRGIAEIHRGDERHPGKHRGPVCEKDRQR